MIQPYGEQCENMYTNYKMLLLFYPEIPPKEIYPVDILEYKYKNLVLALFEIAKQLRKQVPIARDWLNKL